MLISNSKALDCQNQHSQCNGVLKHQNMVILDYYNLHFFLNLGLDNLFIAYNKLQQTLDVIKNWTAFVI